MCSCSCDYGAYWSDYPLIPEHMQCMSHSKPADGLGPRSRGIDPSSLLFLPLNISPHTSVSLLVILVASTDQCSLHKGCACVMSSIWYGSCACKHFPISGKVWEVFSRQEGIFGHNTSWLSHLLLQQFFQFMVSV